MDIGESLNILQNTCKSEDNVLAYKSVYDLKYTIPKRENCGTYKPKNTNITSRCFCDDIYDPRKMKIIFSQIIDRYIKLNSEWFILLALTFVNELQVLDFAWKPNLANAATSMFWKRKKRVEEAVSISYVLMWKKITLDVIRTHQSKYTKLISNVFQLDRFYLERPDEFFKTNGYIRTIAYRFKMGNDNKQVGMEGKNYVKVTVEHQFNANSSMTLEVLQEKHRKLLSDLQGKLQKTQDDPVLLNVVPSSVIQGMWKYCGVFFILNTYEEWKLKIF